MTSWRAEVAVPLRATLGEGPWWDAPRERLLWVDIPGGRIHAYVPATGETGTAQLDHPVGFVVGARGGRYVAGSALGLLELDADLRPSRTVAEPVDLGGGRRINDGACDPVGRVLFGTVDPGGRTTGTLWCVSPDGSLVPLLDGIAMSNGVAFSPDGRRLYYVDSPTGEVLSFGYDVRTGRLCERRVLCRVPASVGLPDGLAVDSEGSVWVAVWGAGEVWAVRGGGRRVGVVDVPAACTSSCAFGGRCLERLYITTARDGDALGGAVFVADTGAVGAPAWTATLPGRAS